MGDLVPSYREASAIAEPQFLAKAAIKLGQDSVGVNMSSAAFKAELAALKKQHPRIQEQVDATCQKGHEEPDSRLGRTRKNLDGTVPRNCR